MRWDPTVTSDERCDTIRTYGDEFSHIEHFIETGSADGDTCRILHNDFKHLWTVEIVPTVFRATKQRLEQFPNIHCFEGDSTVVLPQIFAHVQAPAVFWLDGHYCGSLEKRGPKDTPVADELEFIFSTGYPHVVLIDDARLFGTDPNYPTVEWVRDLITDQEIRFDFSYLKDMMIATPR